MKYKKTIIQEVEAIQWNGNNLDEIKNFLDSLHELSFLDGKLTICFVNLGIIHRPRTLEIQDWVVRCPTGYYDVVTCDEFKKGIYEKIL